MGLLRFLRGYNYPFKAKTGNRVYTLQHIQSRGLSKSELFNDKDAVLPVLVIGAGPVGLVLSILLTRLGFPRFWEATVRLHLLSSCSACPFVPKKDITLNGIKCAVLEKNITFSKHPQAHFINNRSMEIFRKIDGLVEEIQSTQPPVDLWRKFVYCTSLSGSTLGSVDHIQRQDLELVTSPVSVAHFSQYKLNSLLLRQLKTLDFRLCAPESSEENNWPLERKILMGHECVSIDSSNGIVTVTASLIRKGKRVEKKIHCNILVGADGAGSTVRKLVGIQMKGETDLQKLVSVHFLSKDLGQYLLKENPGMLFFIFNTEAIGVLVAHDLRQGEFVLQMPFYPPQQTIEDFSSKACEKLISELVGKQLDDINVVDIRPWVMHAEVAEKFISSGNQIFLAGDAAHRFPPAGGFGMNTGIQDAHNLAWKIAAMMKGIAPPSLLNTYEMERQPIAIFNTELSLKNYKAAMAVPSALGLDPTVANSVHSLINTGLGFLPHGLRKGALEGIFAIGRAQLSKTILNESNPVGSSRLSKLRHIFEEGNSLQLQFPAEDLGFRYLQGAIVQDSNNLESTQPLPTGRRRDYIPSTHPGSRLPHMYVRVNKSNEIVSTLDLLSGDKVEFLLIIAPVKESYNLARAAFKVAEERQILVKVCVIWPSGSVEGFNEGSKTALSPWENYVDVFEVDRPSTSNWWSMCQMKESGAILVRPDEHIAWRTISGLAGDPIVEMQRVFSVVLGVI